jgi:hypothetical protein
MEEARENSKMLRAHSFRFKSNILDLLSRSTFRAPSTLAHFEVFAFISKISTKILCHLNA